MVNATVAARGRDVLGDGVLTTTFSCSSMSQLVVTVIDLKLSLGI